jgi:outer membrane protein
VKRSVVILAALATLAGATLLTSHMFAQAQGGQPAGSKTGLINMAAVLKGYNKFSIYNNEIEKLRIGWEKSDKDLKTNYQAWQKYKVDNAQDTAKVAEAEKNLKTLQRAIEDSAKDYNDKRSKKSDEQMVQMWKEIEEAVKRVAPSVGCSMVLHFSDPLSDADKYSAPNIQRKLVGPGSSGGVCPVFIGPGVDISQEVVQMLNTMYPATPVASPAGAGPQPSTPGHQQ